MKNAISAGLLMYKIDGEELKVFLVHPGGPLFSKKDDGYWGIPKGLADSDEDLLETAKREFEEETGIAPIGDFYSIDSVKLKSGKIVHAWAFEFKGDSAVTISSNSFELEWPPHSGRKQSFPEIDEGRFFKLIEARKKMNPAQVEFLNRLEERFSIKKNQKNWIRRRRCWTRLG